MKQGGGKKWGWMGNTLQYEERKHGGGHSLNPQSAKDKVGSCGVSLNFNGEYLVGTRIWVEMSIDYAKFWMNKDEQGPTFCDDSLRG